jgi:4'-phosphopantetheinyl transferase
MPGPTAHIWLVEVDDEAATARALTLLPAPEVDRLSAVVASLRSQRLCAQAALRALVADAIGSTPLMVQLERDGLGKPYLVGDSGLQFNLAHSGKYAMVSLTMAGPIGVDVELPRAVSDLRSLARTMLADREYHWWCKLAEPAASEALFRRWTYKEAVLKALGLGLSGGLRAVSTRPGSDGQPVLETILVGADPPTQWTLRDLFTECRIPAAVAIAAPQVEIQFHRALIGDLVPAPGARRRASVPPVPVGTGGTDHNAAGQTSLG